MIKTIPSKVFNKAYDKWNKAVHGERVDKLGTCSYCNYFSTRMQSGVRYIQCDRCPLSKANVCITSCLPSQGKIILFFKYYDLWDKDKHNTPKAKAIARKILQAIVDNCVYECNADGTVKADDNV